MGVASEDLTEIFSTVLELDLKALIQRGLYNSKERQKQIRSAFPTVCSEEHWLLRGLVNVTWEKGLLGKAIWGNTDLNKTNHMSLLWDILGLLLTL